MTKPKTKRRSPHAHTVNGFTKKNGKRVGGYNRGSGAPTRKNKRAKKIVGAVNDKEIHGYVVNLQYSNDKGDGESVFVIADQSSKTILKDYKEVMDEAFEERTDPRDPIAVDIVDPDIGQMIKLMGRKVKGTLEWGKPKMIKAGKLGAKYAVKATMISARTIKAGAELATYKAQTKIAESMLKPCWQADKVKRIAARRALKLRYPSLYEMCDFSNEKRRGRRRKAPEVNIFPRRYVDVN